MSYLIHVQPSEISSIKPPTPRCLLPHSFWPHAHQKGTSSSKKWPEKITTAKEKCPPLTSPLLRNTRINSLRISHHSIQTAGDVRPSRFSNPFGPLPVERERERKYPTSPNKLKQDQSAKATTIARVPNSGNNVLHVRNSAAVRADYHQPQYQAGNTKFFFIIWTMHGNRQLST